MKKLLLFMLGVLIALPAFAVSFVYEGLRYSNDYNSTGFVTLTGYVGSKPEGKLVIPETVKYEDTEYKVTSIGWGAFFLCTGLTSIEIPNSVTSISKSAFSGCTCLTELTIPNSVTAIYSFVFSDCTGLTELTIPNSVTSIGESAFSGCSSLKEITIADGEKELSFDERVFIGVPVETLYLGRNFVCKTQYSSQCPFYEKASLTNLTIGNSVTSIDEDAFSGCSGLTELTIPNSVTSIGSSAFYRCSGLTELTIPNSVTSIDSYAFFLCSGLTELTIPNSVTSIGEKAFSGCSGLSNIKVSWQNPIKLYANTFDSGIYSNSTLDIPENTFFSYLASDWKMFENISIVGTHTKVFSDNVFRYRLIENEDRDAVLVSGNYSSMTEANIPERFTDDSDADNPVRYYITVIGPDAFKDCKRLKNVNFNSRNRITAIGENAFYNCSSLSEISIPKSVRRIGSGAFSECSGLKKAEFASIEDLCSIEFGDNMANPLTITEHLYIGGEEVTEVVVPDGIEELSGTFSGGSYLTSIKLPSSIKKIGAYTFYDCKRLTSIEIPSSVTEIGANAFKFCYGLTEITIPGSVTVLGNSAFANCTGLTSIEIPASVTSIGASAFSSCDKLQSFTLLDGTEAVTIGNGTIPNSVTDLYLGRNVIGLFGNISFNNLTIGNTVTEINDSQFKNCTKLDSLKLGSSLTSIGDNAFSGCTALKKVIVPPSVESIGEGAFDGAKALESIIMGHNVKTIGANAFNNCPAKTVSITAQTPPTAPNNTFSSYTGKLWLQDPGDESVMNAYYDAYTCWDRFDSFAMVTPSRLEGDNQEIIGKPGEQFQLTAKVWPENVTLPQVFWRSTNPEIATVDENGLVTLHADISDIISRSGDQEEVRSCKIIAETLYADGPLLEVTVYDESSAGIDEVITDKVETEGIDYEAPYEVYNLNGAYLGNNLDRLARGFYIVRQGRAAKKIAL